MKKFYPVLLGVGALLLSSCDHKSEFTTNYSYSTTNLITSIETGESFAQKATYNFFFNVGEGIATVGCSDITAGNQNYSFTSQETSYTGMQFTSGTVTVLQSPKASVNSASGQSYPLESTNVTISGLNYWNPETPGYTSAPVYQPAILWQYNIGNLYNVKTFAADALYVGKSQTSYPVGSTGETETFESETMTYRIIMNVPENKALLIIYKAKFAASMPIELSSITVEGLDIVWKEGTYAITGTDIIPQIYEGTTATPYPNYIFNSIYFEPTNAQLTEASLTYTVAGRFKGSFTGSYLNDIDITQVEK